MFNRFASIKINKKGIKYDRLLDEIIYFTEKSDNYSFLNEEITTENLLS